MELHYKTIGQSIMAIDKYFKFYFKTALGEHGLNSTEGMVLLVLYGHDGQTAQGILENGHDVRIGLTQDKLIDELHYDKAAMTRTMQALEKKGFVLRGNNPSDSRSYLFVLTAKAKEFKSVMIDILRVWNDSVLLGLDKQSIAHLKISLNCMMENALQLAKNMNQQTKG